MITVPTSDAFVAEIVETYRAPSLLREMPVSVQVVEAKDMRLYGDVIVATETTCTARAWIEAIEVEGDRAVLHCRGGIPGIEGRRR